MTDIIANAKRLLDGAAPAPWKVYAWERHPDSDVYVAGQDLAPPKLTMSSRKRLKTHCNKGHEFTTGNTQWITDANGNRQRRCATCNRESQRRHRERQAA